MPVIQLPVIPFLWMRRIQACCNISVRLAMLMALMLMLGTLSAMAASPLGVAPPDAAMPVTGGPLAGFFGWISHWQGVVRQGMVDALHQFKTSPAAGLTIILGGFGYGVLHAAGPGHGKAVIAAYALANRDTARRAIMLSFTASLVQGLTAIVMVGVLALVLQATAMTMTRYTEYMEIGSYFLMTVLGLWLVWRALRRVPRQQRNAHDHRGHDHAHHDHHHDHDCGCGHAHAIDPNQLRGNQAIGAWQAIVTIGLRPCTGALILLVFALSQGLFWLGVAGTLAMALGTGLMVALLATLSLYARDLAVRVAGADSRAGAMTETLISGAAGLVVLAFGIILLGGALSG